MKWLLVNPYYRGHALREAVLSNLRLLLTSLIDGGDYTAVFLPEGSAVPIYLGAIALVVIAFRRRTHARAAFTLAVALGALLPCTYLSFLWNRVRYIWPFAGAWFVLVACLARELGDLARRADRRLGFVTPAIAFAFAGALATKLPWTVRDLAQSASAIDRQQVTLGRWVSDNLPADALVGVNDTGAIAYLGGRRTFDVVGLTTEGEARYWVAGAGSRFEHYETMPRERLPTHFVVYPQWMSCPPVLGAELVDATVLDQSNPRGRHDGRLRGALGSARLGRDAGDREARRRAARRGRRRRSRVREARTPTRSTARWIRTIGRRSCGWTRAAPRGARSPKASARTAPRITSSCACPRIAPRGSSCGSAATSRRASR